MFNVAHLITNSVFNNEYSSPVRFHCVLEIQNKFRLSLAAYAVRKLRQYTDVDITQLVYLKYPMAFYMRISINFYFIIINSSLENNFNKITF